MKYTVEGLYVKKENDYVLIGLSDKGQDDIGDVMFADLASQEEVEKNDYMVSLEGDKAVTDFSFPLPGRVLAYHKQISENPSLLNSNQLDENWIVKLEAHNLEELDDLQDESGL